MKNNYKYKLIILLLIAVSISVVAQIDDSVGIGGNGDSEPVLINGIDYKGHNVGLINKHGWSFDNQTDMDTYLNEYYAHVGTVLNKSYASAVGYIVEGSISVRSFKYSINITSPSDHVLSTYGHNRPAIANKWRPK